MFSKHLILRSGAVVAALMLGTSLPAFADEGHGHKQQEPWGIAGDASAVKRTIRITMDDSMRFRPDTLQLKQGEVVKFIVANAGKLEHEMVIGTRKALAEHAAQMAKSAHMAHEQPFMVKVPGGKSGEFIWNFNRAGEFDFACLVAGHYQAGMVGKVKVLPAR
ncbi:MAG: plastocyanin [Ramlibacter sp.]|nr:plastocyanin [Ramlibacter sp.]